MEKDRVLEVCLLKKTVIMGKESKLHFVTQRAVKNDYGLPTISGHDSPCSFKGMGQEYGEVGKTPPEIKLLLCVESCLDYFYR